MFGLHTALRRIVKHKRIGLVLFGHGVSENNLEEFVCSRGIHINLKELENSILYCLSLGFEFITMEQLLDLSEHRFESEHAWMHLTFDDGYESNYTLLQHLMHKHQIPWSLFVSTHHAETGNRFFDYVLRCAIFHARVPISLSGFESCLPADAEFSERKRFFDELDYKKLGRAELFNLVEEVRSHLTNDEWRELDQKYPYEEPISKEHLQSLADDPLVHIGAHCHHHVILNRRTPENVAAEEIVTPKEWLKNELKIEPQAFCYPNGEVSDFSPTTRRLCIEAGYRMAFTTVSNVVDSRTDSFEMPRRSIAPTAARTRSKLRRTILRTLKSR